MHLNLSFSVDEFFLKHMPQVFSFLRKIFQSFFETFYEGSGYFLFLTALLPVILMFVVDIIFSFIFSIRVRHVRFFNVLSPKCWRSFSAQTYNSLPAERLKPMVNANRNISLFPPYTYRVNDVIRLKSGLRATYLGVRYIDGKRAYIYRIGGKVYSSFLQPGKLVRRGKIQFNFITNHNTNHNTIFNVKSDTSSSASRNSPNIDIVKDEDD